MQIIFTTPDEREIMSRLCDDLAAKHSPLYKQAHLLLKGAMEAEANTPTMPAMGVCEFHQITGLMFSHVTGAQHGDEILFETHTGGQFRMYHDQDCCETVRVEDICGDLKDLEGSPILQAEVSTNDKDPEGFKREYPPESVTWTFYRIATAKGQVVIRWCGESNGYYSESVDFARIK